jgi:hypothetical protein
LVASWSDDSAAAVPCIVVCQSFEPFCYDDNSDNASFGFAQIKKSEGSEHVLNSETDGGTSRPMVQTVRTKEPKVRRSSCTHK